MTNFTIAEDFPKSEIEFDARFSNPDACYQYLFQLKWPSHIHWQPQAVGKAFEVVPVGVFEGTGRHR